MPILDSIALANKLKEFLSGNVEEQSNMRQWTDQQIRNMGLDPSLISNSEILSGDPGSAPVNAVVMNPRNAKIIYKKLRDFAKLGNREKDIAEMYFRLKYPRLSKVATIIQGKSSPSGSNFGGYFDPKTFEIGYDNAWKANEIPQILGHEVTHAWQNLKPTQRIKTDINLLDKIIESNLSSLNNYANTNALINKLGSKEELKKRLINEFGTRFATSDKKGYFGYLPLESSSLSDVIKNLLNDTDFRLRDTFKNIGSQLYRQQPMEAQAFQGGETASKSLDKFAEYIKDMAPSRVKDIFIK